MGFFGKVMVVYVMDIKGESMVTNTNVSNFSQYLLNADSDDDGSLDVNELQQFAQALNSDQGLDMLWDFDVGTPSAGGGGAGPKGPPPGVGDVLVNYLLSEEGFSQGSVGMSLDVEDIFNLIAEQDGEDGLSELDLTNVFDDAEDLFLTGAKPIMPKEAKGPPPVENESEELDEVSDLALAIADSTSTPMLITLASSASGYELDGIQYDIEGNLVEDET